MTLDDFKRELGNTEFFARERREAERRSGTGRRVYDVGLPSPRYERRAGDRRAAIHVYAVHNTHIERIK